LIPVTQILQSRLVRRETQLDSTHFDPFRREEIPAGEHQREDRDEEQEYLINLHLIEKAAAKLQIYYLCQIDNTFEYEKISSYPPFFRGFILMRGSAFGKRSRLPAPDGEGPSRTP
jgi:hypothetical protein